MSAFMVYFLDEMESRTFHHQRLPETEDGRVERRRQDRRRTTFRSLFIDSFLKGRRYGPRRHTDCHGFYVDWYDTRLFAVSLVIFILCCVDAGLTLVLLNAGAREINALMAALIDAGTSTFVNVKLAATAIGLIVLVIHGSFRVTHNLRVRHVLYGIFGGYLSVFLYQIRMLSVAM